jgi:hypothetical protein
MPLTWMKQSLSVAGTVTKVSLTFFSTTPRTIASTSGHVNL